MRLETSVIENLELVSKVEYFYKRASQKLILRRREVFDHAKLSVYLPTSVCFIFIEGVLEEDVDELILQYASSLKFDEFLDTRCGELSGGNKRR